MERVEPVTPRLRRVTLRGAALAGFTADEPAASVRLLLPAPGTSELVIPTWRGNEFLLPDDTKPVIRTFTPRAFDPERLELDLDVVIHGHGIASEWAATVRPGAPGAISGPGRGYTADHTATSFVIAGDESAIPAIMQVIPALPAHAHASIFIEIAHPDARMTITTRSTAVATWLDLPADASPGEMLVRALRSAPPAVQSRVWAAGEASAMQRIRRFCFDEVGIPRSNCTIRGYWKHGRGGEINA